MIVGVPKETFPGERRVALIPNSLKDLEKAKIDVIVESGAGATCGYSDDDYKDKGAKIVDRAGVFKDADIIVQVRGAGSNLDNAQADIDLLGKGKTVIGFLDPLAQPEMMKKMAGTGANVFSVEMVPRITRAQSMDALSSMATVAGYLAVLQAALKLPKFFPMFMTAAGTITPARVFIIGAGVAGLQAIATAKRLGAVVTAYDLRPEVREQIESLGGKFLEMDLDTEDAQDEGGYAKAQSEDFYKKQQQLMGEHIAGQDVVITTANVPGKKAPTLVTEKMVEGMKPGSVIIDLAAEKGGNCALTKAGEVVDANGVSILGPINLPTDLPVHASQMYAKNITTFLNHLVNEGEFNLDLEDEITKGSLVAKDGEIVHQAVLDAFGK